MIKIKDYKEVILNWTSNKKSLKDKEDDLIKFFENGFKNTGIPSEAYFGGNNTAISFIIGRLYLIAYCHKSDKGIWMIQDKIHPELKNNIIQKQVKSTINCEFKLYWIHFEQLSELSYINENNLVWESYRRASFIVKKTPFGKSIRRHDIEGKDFLTQFWEYQEIKLLENLKYEFENNVIKAKRSSSLDRLKRLKHAKKMPEKVIAKIIVFNRNPDVVAETLVRANGKCELCHKDAPFIRTSDGTPYLEVHHKTELSKGGEDTIDNTLALCPNCHRKVHFGKKNV